MTVAADLLAALEDLVSTIERIEPSTRIDYADAMIRSAAARGRAFIQETHDEVTGRTHPEVAMAGSIEVRRRYRYDGDKAIAQEISLDIDGAPFPWLISADGVTAAIQRNEISGVTLTILADCVLLDDALFVPKGGGA